MYDCVGIVMPAGSRHYDYQKYIKNADDANFCAVFEIFSTCWLPYVKVAKGKNICLFAKILQKVFCESRKYVYFCGSN